jgi:hypothetical protein
MMMTMGDDDMYAVWPLKRRLKNAQKSITPTTFSCHGGSMK